MLTVEAVLLLDLSHTSHTRARTGVQKVCRSLHAELAVEPGVLAVCYDPFRGSWRGLEATERDALARAEPGHRRGARWSMGLRLRGKLARLLGAPPPLLPTGSGLIVPEIFSAATARALPDLLRRVRGTRIALFHDAIALKLPELSPHGTVARFPAYLQELLCFDGIAAVSEDSRAALVDYWRWLGVKQTPPVHAIPLGIDLSPTVPEGPANGDVSRPVVLSVGTLEARKNHLALLDACESLWRSGQDFELHLIGMAHSQTGRPALAKVEALRAAGRPVRYDGPVSDSALELAYQRSCFTVYPSVMEGFGLPVLESLRHGRPCICSQHGALGESARDGGCLTLETVDSKQLAGAIRRLLSFPTERHALAEAARKRSFKSWSDYARDLTRWMADLPRRG